MVEFSRGVGNLVCVVFDGKLVHNETTLGEGEILEYARTALETGLTITVDPPGLSFKAMENIVACYPSCMGEGDAEYTVMGVLMRVKPYPDWLLKCVGNRGYSGLHTVVLVSGDSRFEIRPELSKYANLVLNTGEEDLYVTRGRFNLELEHDGVFVSTGEDFTENVRRVYLMLFHSDGKGIKRYEDLVEYDFHGSDRIRGILIEKGADIWTLEYLGKVLEVFRDELLDLRIPVEACWAMKGLGG